jgi:hypothetical protein
VVGPVEMPVDLTGRVNTMESRLLKKSSVYFFFRERERKEKRERKIEGENEGEGRGEV